MHGLLAVVVAAAEVDPATVRPSPLASWIFGFLLVATALLLWSFIRHLRRAQANLGSAQAVPGSDIEPRRPGAVDPDHARDDSR